MRIVALAYHDIGCTGLERLVASGDEVVAVFTHPDDPDEGGWFGSVADTARRAGIPVFLPPDVNAPEVVARIRDLAPDLIVSLYFRQIVCPEILALPSIAAVNLHGSLLPRYRGRCPLNWALIHGETETGVTLHHMARRPDRGDIVASRRVPIHDDDDAYTLHRKLVRAAGLLLDETLPGLRDGTAPRRPQPPGGGRPFRGRRPEDGRIDWNRPAAEIHDLVRAVTRPWPGARTEIDGRTLYVWRSRVEPARAGDGPPGTFVVDGGIAGVARDGRLRLLECGFDPEVGESGEGFARRLARTPASRAD